MTAGGCDPAGDPLEIATFAATGASLCERQVSTSNGRTLTTPLITFPASHARTILESARREGLVVRAQGAGGSSARAAAEVHLQDEAAAEGGSCGEAVLDSSTAVAQGVEVHIEEVGDADAAGRRPGAGGGGASEQAAVLRRFAFTSEALRSSVIVAFRNVPGTYVYVKGAPEVLADLCAAATLPPNLAEEVSHHTRNGRRVLACAYRACGPAGAAWALEASRADVERNLVWAGLLVMENTLKPDSEQAINDLTAAGLHCSKFPPSRV